MSCGIGAESGLYGEGLHHGYHFRWTSRIDHQLYFYPGLYIMIAFDVTNRTYRPIAPYTRFRGGLHHSSQSMIESPIEPEFT